MNGKGDAAAKFSDEEEEADEDSTNYIIKTVEQQLVWLKILLVDVNQGIGKSW